MADGERGLGAETNNSDPSSVEDQAKRKEKVMSKEHLSEGARVLRLMRRVSGLGEQLTYEQALILTRTYAELYQRFLACRAWIESLEVRIGTKKILGAIQNRPGGLRELMYVYKCDKAEDVVLQIWRSADREFDAVPLLFQELEDVTEEGISRTEHYPTGQTLTLFVRKEQEGEYSVKLSFAAGIDIDSGVAKGQAARAAAAGGAHTEAKDPVGHRQASEVLGSPSLWMQPSGLSYLWKPGLATTLSMLLAFGCFFWGYARGTKAGVDGTPPELAALSTPETPTGPDGPYAGGASAMAGGGETVSQGGDGSQPAATEVETQEPIWRGNMGSVVITARIDPQKEPGSSQGGGAETVVAVAYPQEGLTLHANMTLNRNASCESGPGGLRPIYVAKLEESGLDERQTSGVRAEIIKGLKERGVSVVESCDQRRAATGIIRLQLELSKTLRTITFAGLRDDERQQLRGYRPVSYTLDVAQLSPALSKVSQQMAVIIASAVHQTSGNVAGQPSELCSNAQGGLTAALVNEE